MVNRSRSGPAHLARPSISKESIHVNQRVRSKVHKETQLQPSPLLQEERLAINTEGSSYSSREREVERLRQQVAMLQRETERNEELLHRKDEEMIAWLVIGVGKETGGNPLPTGNESNLSIEKGQSFHPTGRTEGKSKIGRSLKGQFLKARWSLTSKSLRRPKLPMMMP